MNTRQTTIIAAYLDQHSEWVEFGITDERGRKVGVLIVTEGRDYALSTTGCGYSREPGRWLVGRVQPARNGQSYGAHQSGEHFRSRDDMQAYVAAQTEKARKRYGRKYRAKAA